MIQRDDDSTIRPPGPYPFQPLSVEPLTVDISDPDDDARYSVLKFCGSGLSPWIERKSDPEGTGIFDPSQARTGFMLIGHRPDDTRFLIDVSYTGDKYEFGDAQPCDGTQVPVGRFDPQFPFADAPVTEAPCPPLNYTRPARSHR